MAAAFPVVAVASAVAAAESAESSTKTEHKKIPLLFSESGIGFCKGRGIFLFKIFNILYNSFFIVRVYAVAGAEN